jgi:hypothetical protein
MISAMTMHGSPFDGDASKKRTKRGIRRYERFNMFLFQEKTVRAALYFILVYWETGGGQQISLLFSGRGG